MRDNLSCLALVVDKSGSMFDLCNSTINNFNNFIKEQSEVPGEAIVTVTLFNHEVKVINFMQPIKDIPDLTVQDYLPGGNTALYDGVGETINRIGEHLAAMPEEQRPSKVIVTIITDGMENSSRFFNHDEITKLIKHQQEVYNWQFIFLGANIDAPAVAAAMSIPASNAMTYAPTDKGVATSYATASATNKRMRIGTP